MQLALPLWRLDSEKLQQKSLYKKILYGLLSSPGQSFPMKLYVPQLYTYAKETK
jgi:hypothetical protein